MSRAPSLAWRLALAFALVCAVVLGAIGFYDLPSTALEDFMNQVQQLDVAQVRAAMARHLRDDAFVVVSAGPTVDQQPLPPPLERPAAQPAGIPEH